ncbi:MAG: hypothetical protein Q8941_08530 [Bacteroidota bacterium]|nr:hypothetical protein [Bacteroidota bacterium]
MKRSYLLLIVTLLTVSAIKAQTPVQLNDDLAGITDSLFSKGQKWGLTFTDAYKDGNYSPLKPLTAGMLIFINSKIAYVQNMKDIKNSKPLRMAMLDLLAFEKQMISEDFRAFELFDSTTTKEKLQAALDQLTEKSKEEDAYVRKVAAAQQVYAAENGFTIEPGKQE